jgi:succinate dehydrogenase / fumarate reductase cytochrome b subunit
LQVYDMLRVSSLLSITHRATGVFLALGALLLAYWLTAAAYGPAAFERAQALLGSWVGLLVLFGLTFCLFYHLCNGIRHLAWDLGRGYEIAQLKASGAAVVVAAGLLTLLAWVAAFAARGGA